MKLRLAIASFLLVAACGGQAIEQLTAKESPEPTPLDSLCDAGDLILLDAAKPVADASPPSTPDAGPAVDAAAPECQMPEPLDAALLAQIPIFPGSEEPGDGYRVKMVTMGDSLTDEPANPYWTQPDGGVDNSGPSTWVPTIRYLLGSDVKVVNIAHGQLTTAAILSLGANVDAEYEAKKPFIITVQGGANDVVHAAGSVDDAGSPAIFDTTVDNLFTFCDARHAAHPDAVCIILGPSYSYWYSIEGYEHYNARLRAEAVPAHADAVVYLDGDPRLNVYRFSTSSLHVHFFYDQVHPNTNGSTAVALDVLPVVAQIILGKGIVPWP